MGHDVSDGRTPPRAGEPTSSSGGDGTGDGSHHFSQSTTTAMRRVLNAYREGWMLDGRMRDTARLVAEDAHRRGLDAVRTIIAVRGAWVQLEELRRVVPDEDARDLLSRLISCTIEEFYRMPAAAPRADSPSRPGPSAG
jgi:hypothetical protein